MEQEKEILEIDFGQVDFHPAIIDYDFVNNRPRGGSCRVDFFSHGALSYALEDIKGETKVYLKKDNVFFENGMFLIDFDVVSKNVKIFEDMVNCMKFSKIYLEYSNKYDTEAFTKNMKNVQVILMRFG